MPKTIGGTLPRTPSARSSRNAPSEIFLANLAVLLEARRAQGRTRTRISAGVPGARPGPMGADRLGAANRAMRLRETVRRITCKGTGGAGRMRGSPGCRARGGGFTNPAASGSRPVISASSLCPDRLLRVARADRGAAEGVRWGCSVPSGCRKFSSYGAPAVSGLPAGDDRQNRAQEDRERPSDERREHQDEEDQDPGRHPTAEREVDDKGGQDQESEDLDWTYNRHDLLRLPSNAPSYSPDPVGDASSDLRPAGLP